MAPTLAMFVGSMMIPDPIMLTATMNVSCVRVIFFCCMVAPLPLNVPGPSLLDHVGVELDSAVDPFLIHPLNLVIEAGESIERLLEREELVEHRARPVVPA